MKQLFHVYECENCVITFAVEQGLEDQTVVCCPVCLMQEEIRDVVSGEMDMKMTRAGGTSQVG
ncbi:hypothetical protein [Sutcliffiella horikoshii]|uniref:hypothetical protein n=1 Tax=Sutcliffiella horikoshii TaxID=79883 RepID=UPI003CF47593